MTKNFYDLLEIPTNATDYEIYTSFSRVISDIDRINEETKEDFLEAFIVLSDINLRKKYDRSLGLDIEENFPWYNYTYFENGDNFYDINGNLRGDEKLTKLIERKKGKPIRSSISPDAFFSEGELFQRIANFTKEKIKNKDFIPYLSSQIDCQSLSESEKYAYFKKIYEEYKTKFKFSQEFASFIISDNYNQMEIDAATQMNAQQLLISKRGVCTHFASLMYEELKGLGIESYFLRMTLPHWYHHIVLYRINEEWNVCDLTNEYLFGRAGYKMSDTNYMSIPLDTFIKNNPEVFKTTIIPQYGGDTLLSENDNSLKSFIENSQNRRYK